MLWLLKLIDPLGTIVKEIAGYKAAKLDAATEKERIEADVAIEQLEARAAVLVAEQDNIWTRMIRPMMAFPFIVYLWKVLVWDMTLGLGSTPQLGDQLFWVLTAIVGAFFLTRGLKKG